MAYKQMSLEEVSVCRIQSLLKTLIKFHKTSTSMRNRSMPVVAAQARLSAEVVQSLAESWPDSVSVQRWVSKFFAFCDHNGLLIDGSDGNDETGKSAEGEHIQPDTRQVEGIAGTGGSEGDLGGRRYDGTSQAGVRRY